MTALSPEARERLMEHAASRMLDDMHVPSITYGDLRALLADLAQAERERDEARKDAAHWTDMAAQASVACDALRAQVATLRDVVAELIDTAESHAMQAYDRSGATRRKIGRAEAALASTAPAAEQAETERQP